MSTAHLAKAARREADAVAEQCLTTPLSIIATGIEAHPQAYFADVELALAVAAELRRRDAAGIRHWPRPKLVHDNPKPAQPAQRDLSTAS